MWVLHQAERVTGWLTECSAVHSSQLSLGLAPSGEGAVLGDVFHVHSVVLQSARLLHHGVLLPGPLAEAPVLADEDLLTARELELGAPQSLDSLVLELVIGPHRDENLANLDSGSGAVSLSKGASHSSLEPISSGTGQHFVDPQHVEGVNPDPDVEPILAAVLDKVLVAADAPSLESLRGELLQLVRDQVDRQRELVNSCLLTSQVKDPDLGVGDSTVKSALGIGLVFAVAIALGWSPSHLLL